MYRSTYVEKQNKCCAEPRFAIWIYFYDNYVGEWLDQTTRMRRQNCRLAPVSSDLIGFNIILFDNPLKYNQNVITIKAVH